MIVVATKLDITKQQTDGDSITAELIVNFATSVIRRGDFAQKLMRVITIVICTAAEIYCGCIILCDSSRVAIPYCFVLLCNRNPKVRSLTVPHCLTLCLTLCFTLCLTLCLTLSFVQGPTKVRRVKAVVGGPL